jgi:hypothetical protein
LYVVSAVVVTKLLQVAVTKQHKGVHHIAPLLMVGTDGVLMMDPDMAMSGWRGSHQGLTQRSMMLLVVLVMWPSAFVAACNLCQILPLFVV